MIADSPVLTSAAMRDVEYAAAANGLPLAELMERAGAALGALAWRVASGRPIHILAGPGNNGGDGYVAARWLRDHGAAVAIAAIAPPASGLAVAASKAWGGAVGSIDDTPAAGYILVDCVFGTGLSRALDDALAASLARWAAGAARIVAADLPSGVDSDDGRLMGCPFQADSTLALGAVKPAHLLFPAAGACGTVVLADLGLTPVSDVRTLAPSALAQPSPASHKYTRGMVAVVAGAMPGAAELAARAAQRSGAGYVCLIGSGAPPGAPWSIVRRSGQAGDWLADPRLGAIVVGCGLGRTDRAREAVLTARSVGKPLVVDGDALHMCDSRPFSCPAILTPHAGEFAALLPEGRGSKIDQTRAAARQYDAIIVHKGADTVIASPDGRVAITHDGPAWLATAGTGDVLAGICGAMLARGLAPFDAAQTAVALHGRAARRAGPGLCADDLVESAIWP